MPLSGEQVRGRRARESLERGGTSPEGATAVERGGTSPEGATGPQARRNLTRGGYQPSSEVEPHPRGRPTLERGRDSLMWRCTPRAKWSFARGRLGLTILVGRRGRQDCGPPLPSRDCFWARFTFVSSFVFCLLRKKMGFPWFFRGPLWLSPAKINYSYIFCMSIFSS
jgi:hypothetical protein